VMKVSSTLLEQVSAECQLRFNQVFLRNMIGRLQSAERNAVISGVNSGAAPVASVPAAPVASVPAAPVVSAAAAASPPATAGVGVASSVNVGSSASAAGGEPLAS